MHIKFQNLFIWKCWNKIWFQKTKFFAIILWICFQLLFILSFLQEFFSWKWFCYKIRQLQKYIEQRRKGRVEWDRSWHKMTWGQPWTLSNSRQFDNIRQVYLNQDKFLWIRCKALHSNFNQSKSCDTNLVGLRGKEKSQPGSESSSVMCLIVN